MINEVSTNAAYGATHNSLTSARRATQEQREQVRDTSGISDSRHNVANSGSALPQKAEQTQQQDMEQQLQEAADRMREFALNIDRDLEFKVDRDSGTMVIKVFDPETEELVRQIPNEDALSISKALESGLGFLIKAEA